MLFYSRFLVNNSKINKLNTRFSLLQFLLKLFHLNLILLKLCEKRNWQALLGEYQILLKIKLIYTIF